jgi:hypothetical protein
MEKNDKKKQPGQRQLIRLREPQAPRAVGEEVKWYS